MKIPRNIFLLTIFYLLSSCISSNKINLLPINILGLWSGKTELVYENITYEIEDKFFFLPFNILLFNTQSYDGRVYYDLFTYKFVGEDRISIKGRLVDLVAIKQERNSLIINSTHGFPPDGRYTRIVSFWLCLLILILFISIIFMLFQMKIKSRKNILNLNNRKRID